LIVKTEKTKPTTLRCYCFDACITVWSAEPGDTEGRRDRWHRRHVSRRRWSWRGRRGKPCRTSAGTAVSWARCTAADRSYTSAGLNSTQTSRCSSSYRRDLYIQLVSQSTRHVRRRVSSPKSYRSGNYSNAIVYCNTVAYIELQHTAF